MSAKVIEIREAQQHLAQLMDEADDGTEIILSDGNRPRARLIPIVSVPARRIPGLDAGTTSTTDDFDAPLPDDFWTGAP